MEVSFRKARIDDVEKIVRLCNQCFDEDTSIEYATKVFKETMDDPNNYYLIGEINGEVIAHTKITVIPTIYEKMNTYCILNHVCVRPDYRRHNIGMQLLEECEKITKGMGCVVMELWSNNFRQPAHSCYLKYGFKINDAKFFSKDID